MGNDEKENDVEIELKDISLIDVDLKDEVDVVESLTSELEKSLETSGKGEGFASIGQRAFFRRLLKGSLQIRKILEIGMNAAHSTVTFLSARSDIHVTSLDLGRHKCVNLAKKYVDASFGKERHQLCLGDSKETLKSLVKKNETYDLIFIDGGHDLKTAKSDLALTRRLAHSDTIVIMDDVLPSVYWGRGPAQAWSDAVREGLVDKEYERYQCKPIGDDDRRNEERLHCWTVGRFQIPHMNPGVVVFGATRRGAKLSDTLLNYISSNSSSSSSGSTSAKKKIHCESVDENDDYHKIAASVVDRVLALRKSRRGLRVLGVLVGDTGLGVSIAANKFKDVRCALCHDVLTARTAREQIDANVLAIGSCVVGSGVATSILDTFLERRFLGVDANIRRLCKIDALRRHGKL